MPPESNDNYKKKISAETKLLKDQFLGDVRTKCSTRFANKRNLHLLQRGDSKFTFGDILYIIVICGLAFVIRISILNCDYVYIINPLSASVALI